MKYQGEQRNQHHSAAKASKRAEQTGSQRTGKDQQRKDEHCHAFILWE